MPGRPERGRQFDSADSPDGNGQVGPDRGHAGLNRDRMMEFFVESLVLGGGSNSP